MARFIVSNRIVKPDDIRDFNLEAYKFEEKTDNDQVYIFVRKSKT